LDFTKLRLTGFKSFVDPTELLIEPGLTGIVGPNGCGKSNLLEALRWVMGETSARRMRGDDMDDVIFGGTDRRPPRNIAEVTLCLDNRARTAPPAFNDAGELEVTRKIEREKGSEFKINGRTVRARDVQTLFADHGSGAGSTALVSQGKIGALISAKPQERRKLLEEAAGIGGLHARRQEAESRLRTAEANLSRLDDVIQAMDSQLQGLQKQARQARRYRDLSDLIRKAEAITLHLKWTAAEAAHTQTRQHFDQAEQAVRDQMQAVAQATTRHEDAAAGLPPLRQTEAEAGAALHRLEVEEESLQAEARRLTEATEAAHQRLAQLDADAQREDALRADAEAALARLTAEREQLAAQQADEEPAQDAAENALAAAEEEVERLELALSALTEAMAEHDARLRSLEGRVTELTERVRSLSNRRESQRAALSELDRDLAALPDATAAASALAAAEDRAEQARDRAEARAETKAEADAALALAREALSRADADVARLRAEESGLTALLADAGGGDARPMADRIDVALGFEAAVAAAFGSDLEVGDEAGAPVYWQTLPALNRTATAPDGTTPLARYLRAPEALTRRLALVALVPTQEAGDALQTDLQPGQMLVSTAGDAWRWDGLRIRADAPTTAAVRLRQRNRLVEVRAALDHAEEAAAEARRLRADAEATFGQASDEAKEARLALKEADDALARARADLNKQSREADTLTSKRTALIENHRQLEEERAAAQEALATAEADRDEALTAAPDRARLADLRQELSDGRRRQTECRSRLDQVIGDARARGYRLQSLETERNSWLRRLEGAAERVTELAGRRQEAAAELDRLIAAPAALEQRRQTLLGRLSEAKRRRRDAADALAEADHAAGTAEKTLKQSQSRLGEAREERIRAEAAVGAAIQTSKSLEARIAERLDCAPTACLAEAGLDETDNLPAEEAIEARLQRLTRERDTMGPVNLRAEMEAAELDQQVTALRAEREDLSAAVERLRQAIATLNREARQRLMTAFQAVRGHFEKVFVRLFGGGHAQLQLTETDDPLNAGLEVLASPPGKRLQVLSLLSGGEQALTALSLLFAVFLTSPTPVCVLDEVDAPLDESNVDRVCDLLEDMAGRGQTRFLLVTHHRLTMARVDRLYGVTMAERGISQLVSVDLRGAEALRAVG